ncbi:hypothetical protein CDAR_614161 [Caerostris darwini]|uniref:Uncharacterized protein n=1 Tax=Caerostris darwini TaxID=1538125 RepID=A0AAV4WCB0_9ARAC|nr:hypothetical protein CDAR_614161 [Caerostris darwini]
MCFIYLETNLPTKLMGSDSRLTIPLRVAKAGQQLFGNPSWRRIFTPHLMTASFHFVTARFGEHLFLSVLELGETWSCSTTGKICWGGEIMMNKACLTKTEGR